MTFLKEDDPKKMVLDSNVKGTESILKACRDFKLKKCIFTSSLNTLFSGNTIKTMYTDEDWGDETSKNMAIQDKSKIIAEKKVWEFREELTKNSNLELMTINPGIMIGK